MEVKQTIQKPFGITVFGSAIIRVEPDTAVLTFAVSNLDKHPQKAFQPTRQIAQKVSAYLVQTNIKEVSTSRISLNTSYRYTAGENKFEGYLTKITYTVLLRNLEQVENVLSGVVDAGVNDITSVDFQTSRLKEIRIQARQRAVDAAKEKAEIYCTAAGVRLGNVIHIEDVNPDQLRGREGHVVHEIPIEEDGPLQAVNPGSIVVGAAVLMAFSIQ